MKASKYNYIVQYGDKAIFFNGLTESFFLVTLENISSIQNIIDNPNENIDVFTDFIDTMKSKGFIVPEGTNELEYVKTKYDILRKRHQYFLMILPTYQCNLRCWYCTQNHKDMFMSDEIVESIKKLIKQKISDDNITELHLSWFGGEPLLAYDIVLELTFFARDITRKAGKAFSSAITTNGTLLTPERIESLYKAGISHYQITIDGDRNSHNAVKKIGKISTFDRTLDNINLIARHSSVNVRINYNKDNLKPDLILRDFYDKIELPIRHNISVSLFKVWQEDKGNINCEDLDKLFENCVKAGIYTSLPTTGVCYADRINYDCIFPNGRVGKCDNHNPDELPGILKSNGTIEWTEDMTVLYMPHVFDYELQQCAECRYLPICWGPCVSVREKMLRKEGRIKCHFENPDLEIQNFIINFCKTKLQRTS